MVERYTPLLTRSFLKSVWSSEFENFKNTQAELELVEKLKSWSRRKVHNETSAESAFEQTFFQEIWGYTQSGQDPNRPDIYTHFPKFSIAGGSAKGGTGEADSALGRFAPEQPEIPQVVCEYKDIKSGLDLPQRRGSDRRSPVRQALDYLAAATRNLPPFAPIQPAWAIVTDMNEFRLYWGQRGDREYLKFTIERRSLLDDDGLLQDTEDARFDRFVFCKIFGPDMLLVPGASGRSPLANLIDKQWIREKDLEKAFYREYRTYRENLYLALLKHNSEGSERFPGTKGRLVRLAQKILDRFIFVFFCEDMGSRIGYPPQLLRDFLIKEAASEYFDPHAFDVWERIKTLFGSMNTGGKFGTFSVSEFNGGLFADDPQLNALKIPNRMFCAPGQGINEASLAQYKNTLLYMSARYNYATGFGSQPDKAAREATELGLYTLGRIFEQSITELEVLEAEADGRPSLNKITKRKRDGVYYTPEWVVERIVEDTLGRRLEELKSDCGWPLSVDDSARGKKKRLESIAKYEALLSDIRVVDPACGSGAFLITALRRLTQEWAELRYLRVADEGGEYTPPGDRTINRILTNNIYGVDINASSVEIAKLALWLHTANGQSPLSSLDQNIREGNSLIGTNFFDSLAAPTLEERERINPFDWEAAFPDVFDSSRPNGGGFDIVIGNPPYVKLQNFRKVHADMAAFLQRDRAGNISYHSTQTKNFDLYLPFIEKGISLLNDKGRLGYIAPNVWIMNQYGEGLRNWLARGQHLEGWIDFGSHQVFEEATIYTSLQYFTKSKNDKVFTARAYDGFIKPDVFADKTHALPYRKLTFRDRWLLVTGKDRAIIDTAMKRSKYLDHKDVTNDNIFVGIQTSADDIYHLKKIAAGRYLCRPNKSRETPEFEVVIEDAIMKPLVSGQEAKRYIAPETDTYLLFPYDVADGKAAIIPASQMETKYPLAWAYLKKWETELRERESSKMDDDEKWWGYNYPKNLTRQEIEKLIVPRLVTRVFCAVDEVGAFYLDNVDVGGVAVNRELSPHFVAGVLNSRPCGHIFRQISKPFRGDYRSANKQFIAPLPIPKATKVQRDDIAKRAKKLQKDHTKRRELISGIGRRLSSVATKKRPDDFLFPELPVAKKEALSDGETITAAKNARKEALAIRHDDLTDKLSPGVSLSARLIKGELQFLIDSVPVIAGLFLSGNEAQFVLSQWNYIASTFNVTPRTSGKSLAHALQNLAVTEDQARIDQVIKMQTELIELEQKIETDEANLDQIIFDLYGLSKEQISYITQASA